MAGKERNENSVLISIDDLTASAPNQAAPGAGPGRDESGLIDLQGLENAGLVGRKGGDVDSPSSAPGFEPSSTLRVTPARQGPGVGLIVGVALGTILVLGGGVVLGIKFFGGDAANTAAGAVAAGTAVPSGAPSAAVPSGPTSVATAGTEAAPASGPASAPESVAAAAGSTPESDAEEADDDKANGKTPAKPSRPSGTRPTKRTTASAPVAPTTSASRAMAATAEPPKRNSEVDDMLGALEGRGTSQNGKKTDTQLPPDPTLPPSLSRQQIMSVVTRNAAGVRKCSQEVGGGSGTAVVEMVINASGNVTEANVVGGELKGTPLGDCVSRKVKVFRFAQFNGDSMRIKMPFRL